MGDDALYATSWISALNSSSVPCRRCREAMWKEQFQGGAFRNTSMRRWSSFQDGTPVSNWHRETPLAHIFCGQAMQP